MTRSILIASGKGGVGKSTVASRLGAALAEQGQKVLLVDCDAGLSSLDLMLDVSEDVAFHWYDVYRERCEAAEAVDALRSAGFLTLGFALQEPCLTLGDARLRGLDRAAVFLGTEDTGLTQPTLSRMDHIVRIPMAAGIDSLNVAAAAAIAFWELRDSRQPGSLSPPAEPGLPA